MARRIGAVVAITAVLAAALVLLWRVQLHRERTLPGENPTLTFSGRRGPSAVAKIALAET